MFEMSLVGTNSEALSKAFTEFKRWATSSDGDAVELTFIFLKEGGYVLSICREHHTCVICWDRSDTLSDTCRGSIQQEV